MSLREELEAIYERRGVLTPALVVEEARRLDHPLHSRFEWDDEIAGEAYRRAQAQTLIRSVRIRYVSESTEEVSESVRGFTSVRTPAGYAYQPTIEVISDPLKAKMALNDMKREWQTLKRRYQDFEQFWALVQADLPHGLVEAEELDAA